MDSFTPTKRSEVKRLPKRAEYERAAVYRILDEGFVCHVGFCVEGRPVVIPTGYGRIADKLYIHGSPASRMLRALEGGIDVCVTVTLVDALVLARSAFHHSMNYRSVVVFGRAEAVADASEKLEALRAFSEHVIRGRWDDARQPDERELRATLVLALPLVEASAKIRTGPPLDDEEDYQLPIWAGLVPLRITADAPVADPRLDARIAPPAYTLNYKRG
ncbi:MAG TPA: pyridoxamine 5'-phosphate oxidase family protein [Pyrinomonadaceae bacterium]|jgi:nitroimidazol reductase NimA-like FMN-containing flavoprotein (pyridoxamine 5'-phosphate oxidase superfamily)|nr:pyridoxamine 5'-phosphate oxidase family protein [Pyrinomonadaceae bacterium]